MHTIIVRPIITEQSMANAQRGKFTFLVIRSADKIQIKKAVEKGFDVHVVGVSTTVVKGKTKRVGKRKVEVVSVPVKKAVVELKAGEKIDAFELGGGI